MNFKSLSIAASAAILSVSLMTGCGGSSNNNDNNDNTTNSTRGTAFDGPLTGVTVTGLDANSVEIKGCSTDITDTNSNNTGDFVLTCLEKPVFIKVSPTKGAEAKDLGFDGLLGGGDDTTFTDTFYATVDGEVVNVTPLTYLQYMTPDNNLDLGTGTTGTDAGDIFTIVSAVNVLKAAGFNGEEAYGVAALSLAEDENATLRMIKGFKINKEALDTQKKKASDRQTSNGGEALKIDTDSLVAAANAIVKAAEDINLTSSLDEIKLQRKAVAAITKSVAKEVKKATESTDGKVADVSKMTNADAIKAIADVITESEKDGKSLDLESAVVNFTQDGNITLDNIITVETPKVINKISATTPTFTKSFQINTSSKYKIVDQMFNIAITDLNLSNNSDVNLSVCIKNSDGNQSVTFSTEGGDLNNNTITFAEGTEIIIAQNNIPSLGEAIGYASSATLDSALVNNDLAFNIETVLNAVSQDDTKMEGAVKALDDFLANKDTYTMKISSNLLSETIVGTILVNDSYGTSVVDDIITTIVDDVNTTNGDTCQNVNPITGSCEDDVTINTNDTTTSEDTCQNVNPITGSCED